MSAELCRWCVCLELKLKTLLWICSTALPSGRPTPRSRGVEPRSEMVAVSEQRYTPDEEIKKGLNSCVFKSVKREINRTQNRFTAR